MNNNDINNAIKIAGIIVPIITALIGLVTAMINNGDKLGGVEEFLKGGSAAVGALNPGNGDDAGEGTDAAGTAAVGSSNLSK